MVLAAQSSYRDLVNKSRLTKQYQIPAYLELAIAIELHIPRSRYGRGRTGDGRRRKSCGGRNRVRDKLYVMLRE